MSNDNLIESPPNFSSYWAEQTIRDMARKALNPDGLLDRAAEQGYLVNFTFDWFPDMRVRRVNCYILTAGLPEPMIIGSVDRDEGQPFGDDLRALFEQVRRQLLLLL